MCHFDFSGEFFLADYLMKIGNFGSSHLKSVYADSGIVDLWNSDKDELTASVISHRETLGTIVNNDITYDFIIVPCHGFLASPDLLLNNCELRINFDRADSKIALVRINGSDATPKIDIKDCFAKAEYVSSPELREYFERVSLNPILYAYEDVNVITKPIPKSLNTVRFDNIRAGNTPKYIFFGVIDAELLTGSVEKPSTKFSCMDVEEASIYYNGNVVPGYPIKTENNRQISAFHQFNDVTGRYLNTYAGSSIKINEFEYNFVWSHKLEAEAVNGSVSIELNLKSPYSTNKTLVVWLITDNVLSIDKDNIVEKLQ